MAEIKQVFIIDGMGSQTYETREEARQALRGQSLADQVWGLFPTLDAPSRDTLSQFLVDRPNDMLELLKLAKRVSEEP